MAHVNITEVIEIVLIVVDIVWVIGILVYVNRRSQRKEIPKSEKNVKLLKQKSLNDGSQEHSSK